MLSVEGLKKLCPTAKAHILQGICDHQEILERYEIIQSPLRLTHFLAQIAHESAHFRTTREFASGAAYEGRRDLGNVRRGDGKRFRGRGLIQLTGRANYTRAEKETGKPLTTEPLILEQFPLALEASCLYWKWRNLNKYADRNDIRAITLKINGGLNGFADRKNYFNKAWKLWGENAPKFTPSADKPESAKAESESDPLAKVGEVTINNKTVLAIGSVGDQVMDLQKRLNSLGDPYTLDVDGIFGPLTKRSVELFQRDNNLAVDGLVGPATWSMLTEKTAEPGKVATQAAGGAAAATGVAAIDWQNLDAAQFEQILTNPQFAPLAIVGLLIYAAFRAGISYNRLREKLNARRYLTEGRS